MTPVIPALAGALLVAGVIGVLVGARPSPEPAPRVRVRRLPTISKRTRLLALVGVAAGLVVALATGWVLGIVLIPAVLIAVPTLLSAPATAAQIAKLEALEEWIRALCGVLTVGRGLEDAIKATRRSTPEPIRPEVQLLIRRLRARYTTEEALRLFADDLDDTTGDMVAADLILAAKRRGQGLTTALEALAESVAEDVRARRAIEADRAKPRTTARWVTIITLGALAVLAATGSYVQPYTTPVGQLILIVLLSVYAALLVWMRNMAKGTPIPRFLGAKAHEEALR